MIGSADYKPGLKTFLCHLPLNLGFLAASVVAGCLSMCPGGSRSSLLGGRCVLAAGGLASLLKERCPFP